MRYSEIHVPPAGADDFAAAFSTPDPRATIKQHLDDLKAKRDELDLEIEKWQRADGAAELFTAGVELAKEAVNALHKHAQEANGQASLPPSDDSAGPPATRRDAVLRILHESLDRIWRTGDVVEELFRRGWSGEGSHASVANSVSNILSRLEAEGVVTKLRKGQYRLRSEDERSTHEATAAEVAA